MVYIRWYVHCIDDLDTPLGLKQFLLQSSLEFRIKVPSTKCAALESQKDCDVSVLDFDLDTSG